MALFLMADSFHEQDYAIVVSALKALWRERTSAYHCAAEVAHQRGLAEPCLEDYGIDEVDALLKRIEESPASFNHA